MLSDARYETSLPCTDLARAKKFYADKLGLTPSIADMGGARAAWFKDSEGNLVGICPAAVTAFTAMPSR